MRLVILQPDRPFKALWSFNTRSVRSHECQLGPRIHLFSTSTIRCQAETLSRTRNVGIIAHIDAGKTTTTERMLYYSGSTRRIGDVDEGSTVTDFLPAERSRGITIQSAAVTFHWPPKTATDNGALSLQELQDKSLPRSTLSHTINLIDTPGHADFTFEVLRSLRVLDGAVCILDGVAGVEAQTEQVWRQASTYHIPRIVYINKLDREGAAFGRTVREIGTRLGGWPAVCQIPWFERGSGRFAGIADAVNLHALRWDQGGDGKSVKMFTLKQLESEENQLAEEVKRARATLVELLSEHDESMVERFFEYEENHLMIPSFDVIDSLRRCTLKHKSIVIPVFAGASFRNMGVQPLLDAVVNLLPSPMETVDPEVSIGDIKGGLQQFLSGKLAVHQNQQRAPARFKQKKLAAKTDYQYSIEKLESCSLAFKVVNDAKRGILVYVRVYSGSLDRNDVVFNTSLNVSERAPRLLQMHANDAIEVDSIPAGHIGVIVGLKYARTGDTLVSCSGNKATPPEPLDTLQLRPINVPPPVFFASIEPHSLSEQKRVEEALALLLREDPSLHVSVDEDSGQTLLSGMGELHLEIARDRLLNDLKAKASMGRIEIGYREAPLSPSGTVAKIFDKEVAGRRGKAGCSAAVEPFDPVTPLPVPENTFSFKTHEGNQIIIVTDIQADTNRKGVEESPVLPADLSVDMFRNALYNGCMAALARGPQFAFPMHSTRVTVTVDPVTHLFGAETTASALSAAARLAVSSALKELGGSTSMMEPVMNVAISVDEASLGAVVHDISASRGGQIISLDEEVSLPISDLSAQTQSFEELTLIDPSKIYAPPDPFETSSSGMTAPLAANRPRTISAKVPLKEMVGYLKHLRSLSAGRGTFVMSVDRFESMTAQRQRAVLAELRGEL